MFGIKNGIYPVFARVDLSLQFRHVRSIYSDKICEVGKIISDDIYSDEYESVLLISNNKNELYKAKLAF